MSLLDTSRCCKICHSADGGDVFVCCAGKKQLLFELR